MTEGPIARPSHPARVHVHVNAAASVDGKLSTRRREQIRISGEADQDRLDALRAEADAVAVGVGTVLADDPELTVDDTDRIVRREDRGDPPQPAAVVLDTGARTPLEAALLDTGARTFVLAGTEAPADRVAALEEVGAGVIRAGQERVALGEALAELESHGVERLLVEGGGEVVFSLFQAGLADELTVYVGSLLIGGREAPTLADGQGFVDPAAFPALSLVGTDRLDDGIVLRYHVE